jgi:hypothetical protein
VHGGPTYVLRAVAGEARDGHGLVGVLAQHQRRLAAALDEQVADRFIIDLEVRQGDFRDARLLHLLDLLKQLLHGHEDDARRLRGSPAPSQCTAQRA